MVRQLTETRPRGWKGMLAAFVAAGAVAWQIMACVESPMSFSPGGDLAFTVMDPYGHDDMELAGTATYRVMILTRDRELREIERSSTHMLSAPGFSPDGAQFAYLRIPLLTQEERQRIKAFVAARDDLLDEFIEGADSEIRIGVAPDESGDESRPDVFPGFEDTASGRRFVQSFLEVQQMMRGGAWVSVELVARRTATGEIVTSVPVELPSLRDRDYLWDYLLTQPGYSPDRQQVVFAAHRFAMSVNLSNGEARLLAVGATNSALSPGGDQLATIIDSFDAGPSVVPLLALIDMDGQRAISLLPRNQPSLSGLFWIGDDLLAVLEAQGGALDIYHANGGLQRTVALPAGAHGNNEQTGELAVSPDGAYLVVSFGNTVHFLSADGQILGTWQQVGEDQQMLVQPAFTPDSRQVAFKSMVVDEGEDGWSGATDIVFFTPEGRELSRVPIPRIPPDERPAPPAPVTEEPQQ